jgi:hypothetical protein
MPAAWQVSTTSVTFLYDSGASSMTSLGEAIRIEIPCSSNSLRTSCQSRLRLDFARLKALPAPWHVEPNVFEQKPSGTLSNAYLNRSKKNAYLIHAFFCSGQNVTARTHSATNEYRLTSQLIINRYERMMGWKCTCCSLSMDQKRFWSAFRINSQ